MATFPKQPSQQQIEAVAQAAELAKLQVEAAQQVCITAKIQTAEGFAAIVGAIASNYAASMNLLTALASKK